MPARPRKEIVDPTSPGYYLVSQQVVRGLRLTGVDPANGRDYTYRQEKLERRIQDLASVYLIEVCEFNCGEDGFQLLVRIRPDLVRMEPDESVVRRMLRRSEKQLELRPEPSDEAVREILSDHRRVQQLRERVANLSQFMGDIDEALARDVNRESRAESPKLPIGRLWQGRFHSVKVLDEPALLLAAVQIEAQKVVDGEASSLEQTRCSSATIRARASHPSQPDPVDCRAADASADSNATPSAAHTLNMNHKPPTQQSDSLSRTLAPPTVASTVMPKVAVDSPRDWLLPMKRRESVSVASEPAGFETGSYLGIEYREFRRVLTWTIQQLTANVGHAVDVIPEIERDVQAVFERFRVRVDVWIEAIRNFRNWYRTAIGCGDALRSHARNMGVAWLAGQGRKRLPFAM